VRKRDGSFFSLEYAVIEKATKNFIYEVIIMIRHIVIYNLKNELSETEKESIKAAIKEGLEGLNGKIPGLIEMKIHTVGTAGTSTDYMLESIFESAEALKAYKSNPLHLDIANTKVRPFIETRSCFDFEI